MKYSSQLTDRYTVRKQHYFACKMIYVKLSIAVVVQYWCYLTYVLHLTLSRVTLYTAGHLHTAVPHCSHSRAPIVHTAVPWENNEHGCVYLRCRAVCKLPGCVEGHPWLLIMKKKMKKKPWYILWHYGRSSQKFFLSYLKGRVQSEQKGLSFFWKQNVLFGVPKGSVMGPVQSTQPFLVELSRGMG